ncbi:hypothetical protein OQX63_05870 [Pedobacter sp. PF22-3]|uniref:hypothetical protein n=1 Tax=Pedobacter sp. PF22-3 TaxID=2994467 RepID=UPI00224765F2|nr:hypothetical protein [Pedobacter sp. PF22-3]MCX2492990.1 hypothetical protein [Pedobacter sp. PF22-3]
MSEHKYFALLKFGKLEHLEALRHRGHLHCKPLNYFADLKDECHRGDPLEKVNYMHNIDGAEIRIKDVDAPDSEYKRLGTADTGVFQKSYEISPGNLFCTYSFRLDKEELQREFTIPEDCRKLGNHYLVIKDFEEFIQRAGKRLSELNLTARHGFVGYKDFSKFTGTKTVFEKDITFEFQKEFRIFITNPTDLPLDIEIGSLEDISEICLIDDEHVITFFDVNE